MKMSPFKIFPVLFCLLTVSFVNAQKDKVAENYDQIVHNVAKMVEILHYNESKFDDAFSLRLFNAGFEDLDPDKMIFLQDDLEELRSYSLQLDEELRGKRVEFFRKLGATYNKRVNEAGEIINEILAQPLDLYTTDTFITVRKYVRFPGTVEEKKQVWRQFLTYQVLNMYVNVADTAFSLSTVDTAREHKIRDMVRSVQQRNLERMRQAGREEEIFGRYLNSAIHLLDPHSGYFLPVDRRAFQEDMSGIYYGIGALLQDQNGQITISELMIGGPAWRSGEIEKGDVIIAVKQENEPLQEVIGMSMPDVIRLTRGKKNTSVTITFRSVSGKTKAVKLNREALQLEDTFARSAIIGDSSRIGYIFLPKFYTSFDDSSGRSSAMDIATEVKKLKESDVKGLIIDIRDNGGGSLAEVIRMAGLFIGEGPVVQVKSRDNKPQIASSNPAEKIYDGPLLVLVNERSASASEIFAAAIQDYQRGVVVGSPSTFGKGTVQRGFRVPGDGFKLTDDLGSLHLTWQKYYRVNGDATQGKGVIPDIILPGLYANMGIQEKDFPTALPWDEIEPVNYARGEAPYIPFVQQQSERRRDTIPAFEVLHRNLKKLEENQVYYPLNLQAFREQRLEIRNTYDSIRSSSIRKTDLPVQNTPSDATKLSGREQFRQESNAAWLNRLKHDLYLHEATEVMFDLIGENRG